MDTKLNFALAHLAGDSPARAHVAVPQRRVHEEGEGEDDRRRAALVDPV